MRNEKNTQSARTHANPAMTASVQALRERLHTREHSLGALHKKVQSARDAASKPAAKTISDIQRRYMAAVADLEKKEKEVPKPVVSSSSDAVSSLASRWNKGIGGKEVEKTRVDVRGDVRGAQKNFNATDVPKASTTADARAKKGSVDPGPAELLVEDDDAGLPSWAVNQEKKVIRKENARSSVRDVDVRELQGNVLSSAARDGSEAKGEAVEAKGNVKAALAMWGKTAEEDTLLLKKQREEEERRKVQEEKLMKERAREEQERAVKAAAEKFANMTLTTLPAVEPEEEIELIAYLERKIALVEKDIEAAEEELSKLEDGQ